jgi:short-subunit dehydrogenase
MITNIDTFEPSPESLDGRNILLTGATSGIGEALAIKLSAYNCHLILLGRSKIKLKKLSERLKNSNANIYTYTLDYLRAEASDYQNFIDYMDENFNAIDVLVHNAAMLGDRSPIAHYDIGLWQQVMHVNCNAVFILTRCLIPYLVKGNLPTVLMVSSGVGIKGKAYWGAYSVSKFAIEGLSQILNEEFNQTGIRINVINPGPTNTNMRAKAYPAEDKSKIPSPEMVIPPFLFFISKDAKDISGIRYEFKTNSYISIDL